MNREIHRVARTHHAQSVRTRILDELRIDVVNIADKNVDLALTMNNALNTPACLPEYNGVLGSAPQGTFGIVNTSGVLQCVPLAPRMSGITLKYRF